MNIGRSGVVGILVGFVIVACGSSRSGFDSSSGGGGGPNGGGGSFADSGSDPGSASKPATVGWLHGKVVAPEGTVPVSNAMVYLTTRDVDAIPSGAYCDTCVHLTPLEPYAYTKPDGTFELPAYATGMQHFVVQKGQFRRVRDVVVTTGDQNVAPDHTRLPGKNDAANGDTIPKIAMVVGGYDHIDVSMAKLGIQEFYRYGDGPIDIGTPPGTKTGKAGNDLIGVQSELAKYHITLLPCAAMGASEDQQTLEWTCGAPTAAQKTALAQYVDSGGKVYVTDFAYEAVRQTWPGFVTFYDHAMNPLNGTTAGVGTGCRGGAEDTPGTPQDKDLGAWLTAIGNGDVTLQASWSRIQKVNAQPGFDAEGKPVTITPKVWMTSDIGGGQNLPATVSFQQRCGRVLFSTYHCEGDTAGGLLAQEKALLYILLEVGVCVGELPPPLPPR